MTDDFRQRVEAAKGKTKSVTATVAKGQIDQKPEILLIETRLKENVPLNEQAANVVFMSVEELDEMASDPSKQKFDPRLSDPNVQVITT
ncbi:MAG: hypothetical protein HQ475_12340 [SAR202 cluster bacterium]|nr:hypothetical protein [SAR202 cluster bacterium]